MNRFVFILFIFFPSLLYGQVINQRTGEEFASVKTAVRQSRPHDILNVNRGFYSEGNILIDKPLTLTGHDRPVLDGGSKTGILTIQADSVVVEGFIIQNVGISYVQDLAGIKLHGSRGSILRNNTLENTFFGIMVEKSVQCVVEDNVITGNALNEASSGNAIHLWNSDSMIVRRNIVTRHRDGIYLEFVNESLIEGNLSEHNLRYGLHFMYSDQDIYRENIFRDNGAGVAVMFSENIAMENNKFENNWGGAAYGLLLKEIRDSHIRNNIFRENTSAIYAEGTNRCEVLGNDFIRNGWALKISGNCEDNVFTRNNFFSNTFDLSTNSRQNYNSYSGNYWSEYSGYDLDRDGIGDVPYQPVKLFSYVVDRSEASVILLRSLFIDVINYAEKVMPAITPATLVDPVPLMKPVP